jgi:hypothetical protein
MAAGTVTERNKAILSMALVIAASWALPAGAQSTDPSSPTQVMDNRIEGEEEAKGKSFYYSFEAGPGDVAIRVSGTTNYFSTSMHFTVTDPENRQLSDFVVPVSDAGLPIEQKIHLKQRQRLNLQMIVGMEVGVRVKYTVQIKDSASSPQAMASATATSPASPSAQTNSKDAAPITVAPSAPPVSQSVEQAIDNTPVEDKYALIVGISKFQKPQLDLKYSTKDAKDLADYLVKEAHFAPDHVKLLIDEQATKENVMAELGDKWLPRLAHPNDLVLIFISSHGSPSQMDLEGVNYLVMYNTDPDSLYATGLPLQDLTDAIKHRVHSNRVVVIIDACHSGAASPSKGLVRASNVDSNAILQGTGQLVICSSQPNQVSWESKRYANGVFTRQLIEALRSQSGKTLSAAFQHMKDSVQDEVLQDRSELQTPVMKSKWQGNSLIITAPPTKPRAVPKQIQ